LASKAQLPNCIMVWFLYYRVLLCVYLLIIDLCKAESNLLPQFFTVLILQL
jgi:hypothetical protein